MTLLTALLTFTISWNTHAAIDHEEAQFNPAQRSVKIKSVNYRGSGCPAGSVLSDISPDNEAVTLVFSDYLVEKEAAVRGPQRKNCRIKFELDAPKGWSHALYSMTVQGYADLDPGLIGIQRLGYSYGNRNTRTSLGRLRIQGPYNDEYVRSENIDLNNLTWSNCNARKQKVIINSAIKIRPRGRRGQNAEGIMSTDVVENVLEHTSSGKMVQQFGLVWRKCKNGSGGPSQRRSHMSVCPIKLSKANGQVMRQLMIKARANSSSKALTKAKRKAQRRCGKIAQRRGLKCQVMTSSCRSKSL